MTNENFAETLAALDEVLEKERSILLSGEHEKLPEIVDAKENLLEKLSAIEAIEQDAMAQLDGKLHRNQKLLDEAMKGIRAVADRLSAMRRVRRNLETYDAKGEKRSLEPEKQISMEKRA